MPMNVASYFEPALQTIAEEPQILQNYFQYLQPEVSRQIQEQFNTVDMSVQDPRLKTLARRELLGKLLPRMTQEALGRAIMGQETMGFQRDVATANIQSQIADTQISVNMFEEAQKQAAKNARLQFIGSIIGAGASVLGAPGVLPAVGGLIGGWLGGGGQQAQQPGQAPQYGLQEMGMGMTGMGQFNYGPMQSWDNVYPFMQGQQNLPMY